MKTSQEAKNFWQKVVTALDETYRDINFDKVMIKGVDNGEQLPQYTTLSEVINSDITMLEQNTEITRYVSNVHGCSLQLRTSIEGSELKIKHDGVTLVVSFRPDMECGEIILKSSKRGTFKFSSIELSFKVSKTCNYNFFTHRGNESLEYFQEKFNTVSKRLNMKGAFVCA